MENNKYKTLFMSSRDAVMTLEPPTWAFTSGNPAAVAMFGAKDEENFLSYQPWQLSPKFQPDGRESGEKAKEMIEKAILTGSSFFEWTHTRVNGEVFPAEVLLSKIEEDGKTYLHAVVRDVTDRKIKEDTIKDRLNEVEKLNDMMLGRETRIVELKKEIEDLESKLGNN